MKVLLVHKFYNITGGADFFFREVGRVLEKNGHEVAYYSTDNDNRYEEEGKNVYWAESIYYSSGSIINRTLALPSTIYSKATKTLKIESIGWYIYVNSVLTLGIMTGILG